MSKRRFKICDILECLLHVRFIIPIDVFSGGHISFDGPSFSPKPTVSVTMAVWIKLESCSEEHSVFSTVGKTHDEVQYHFTIRSCFVRWFHRNKKKEIIFDIQTAEKVQLNKWIHIAVTYHGGSKMARVGYRDGSSLLLLFF